MASHFSLSQSLHGSVILQTQQQCLTKPQKAHQQREGKRLNFCQQLRLTAALLGVESSTAFVQVYTYLSLQYLGVPVPLMALNGIAAGLFSMVFIAVAGSFLDKGSNPTKRKLKALLFSLLIYLLGCVLNIAACVVKIAESQTSGRGSFEVFDFNNMMIFSSNISDANVEQQTFESIPHFINNTKTSPSVSLYSSTQEPYLPLTGILGILGFTCLDIGFDIGNPMIRVFILEYSPSSQHSTLLVTATQLASLGGLTMSCLGVFDLPTAIGSAFGVDGTAATFVVMLGVIFTILISVFSTSVWTGITLRKGAPHHCVGEFLTGDEKTPLLIESGKIDVDESLPMSDPPIADTDIDSPEKQLKIKSKVPKNRTHGVEFHGDRIFSKAIEKMPSAIESDSDPKRVPNKLAGLRRESALPTSASISSPAKTKLFNKRLVILFISNCFSVSSLMGALLYTPNAITQGIYGGDPKAEEETLENLNYRKGLRTAAMGSVIFYISYVLSCLSNTKCFKIFGERSYYLATHSLLVITMAVLIITQRIEVYFVVMVAVGPFRTCIFTLPYVMANQFIQPKEGEGPTDETCVGRVNSIIGSIIPIVYVIVCSVMPPVIDVTGNVWLPLIWSCIGNTISMVVFAALFFVKD